MHNQDFSALHSSFFIYNELAKGFYFEVRMHYLVNEIYILLGTTEVDL